MLSRNLFFRLLPGLTPTLKSRAPNDRRRGKFTWTGKKFPGRTGGAKNPVRFDGDTAWFHFYSDSSGHEWGYKIEVTPFMCLRVPSASPLLRGGGGAAAAEAAAADLVHGGGAAAWLADLLLTAAQATSQCGLCLIAGGGHEAVLRQIAP